MKDYLKELNAEQYAAATAIDGYNFILAGAGTGKTKTLIARLAYMIDEGGVNPENILMVTFTNKAAEEMRTRAARVVGKKAEKATIMTFHSFCAMILRRYPAAAGLNPDFQVIDAVDTEDLMTLARQSVINALNLTPKDFTSTSTLLQIHAMACNNHISDEEAMDALSKEHHEIVVFRDETKKVLHEFARNKKQMKMVDYDDLQRVTAKLLSDHKVVLESLSEQYKYISCDEYQDTNEIQNVVLDLLSKKYGNLTVVGDDNQSIYKFRYAQVSNILGFEKLHPGCKRYKLVQNYRSTQEILDLSNMMMQRATEGIPKTLVSGLDKHGTKPVVLSFGNANDEARWVFQTISRSNAPLSATAVIFRSGNDSGYLEAMLTSAGIPFVKHGGKKFLEKGVVRDLLAYLRLASDHTDILSGFRILKAFPGIGEKGARAIANTIAKDGFEALLPMKMFTTSAKEESMQIVGEFFLNIRTKPLQDQFSEIIEFYLEQKERAMQHALDTKEDADRTELQRQYNAAKDDAETLRGMLAEYSSAAKFLSDLTLENKRTEEDADALTLTTIHSAKGLEYGNVILINCVETGRLAYATEEERAEERRCLYVALTRAKNKLIITYPRIDLRTKQETELCGFLAECPELSDVASVSDTY